MARSLKCKASIVGDGLRVVKANNTQHNHTGNSSRVLAKKAVGHMKKVMTEMLARPSVTQGIICSMQPTNVLMALPKKLSLNRILRCHQQKLLDTGLPPCPTDMGFIIPSHFADFILYDSGAGKDRLIILGCVELLNGLARSSLWLADGTFKVVPSLFFQLYSHWHLSVSKDHRFAPIVQRLL